MGILNLLPSHKVVEINLSTGIRIGHMLAQHAYKPDGGTLTVDNGLFFRMSKANPDEVVLADDENAVGPYYLHYTEELLTHGLSNAKKYFAVEVEDGVCYPRCIALYSGDTFTTDNFTGTLESAKFASVGADGVLALSATYPTGAGPVFQVTKATLPDGITPAAQCVVIDPCQPAPAGVGA